MTNHAPTTHLSLWRRLFAPTVPRTRYAARSLWTGSPVTIVLLVIGLASFGAGEGLLVQSRLGATPWTVFAQGLAHTTGLSIGSTTALISITLLTFWFPLRQQPGLGTVANLVVIAATLQITVDAVPHVSPAWSYVFMAAGITCIALGGALYLTCALGPGPRDGLMVGLQRQLKLPIAWIRMGIEVTVLVVGIILGGTFGIGTVLFALCIGPMLAVGFSFASFAAPVREPIE